MYLPKNFTHIGLDETGLSLGNKGSILVGAVTTNPALAKPQTGRPLKKAKDYLRKAGIKTERGLQHAPPVLPAFPSLEEMLAAGLEEWMRVRTNGTLPRPLIEHASIAYLVQSNGFRPERTVLHIDAFFPYHDETRRLIAAYLHRQGFPLPERNIEVVGWGDQCVPIINYADLLAFLIGLEMNHRYARAGKDPLFQVRGRKIEYDGRRVAGHLTNEQRSLFQDVAERYL